MMDSQQVSGNSSRWLWAILALGLLLRLIFVLVIDFNYRNAGGDTPWLMTFGLSLMTGTLTTSPATGPAYLVFDGLVQLLVGPDMALQAIRILNTLMGTALCGFIYIIGTRYFNNRVGLWTALAIAINPIFIIEAGNVLTESLFLVLLFGALALYAVRQDSFDWRVLAIVGGLLGLATLTRAVSILLPVVLVVHLIYTYRKTALKWLAAMLISYVLVVSVWSVYSVARWNTFVIAAQGLAANLYLGTTSWCGPACVDQQAGITAAGGNNQNQYVQGTVNAILSDPVGYVRHRIENLLDAELQPHNTPYFPGESIKAIIQDWWSHGHALSDLGRISQSSYFWQKLVIYVFHFAALLGGLIGLVIGLRQFGARLPVYGTLAYFLVVHTALTAIPRYLFPIEPQWWLFSIFAVLTILKFVQDGFRKAQTSPKASEVPQPIF